MHELKSSEVSIVWVCPGVCDRQYCSMQQEYMKQQYQTLCEDKERSDQKLVGH